MEMTGEKQHSRKQIESKKKLIKIAIKTKKNTIFPYLFPILRYFVFFTKKSHIYFLIPMKNE